MSDTQQLELSVDADLAQRLGAAREAYVAGDWAKLADALDVDGPADRPDRLRYQQLAKTLLATPDPVYALAHQVGDEAGRIDAQHARLAHVEAELARMKLRLQRLGQEPSDG